MTAELLKQELFQIADPQKEAFLPYFFKTGKGQYGEGDKFIGVVVPKQRALVKKYKTLEFKEIDSLLTDEYHECRMLALFFLVEKFKKSKDENERENIYTYYIGKADRINNWDLVDLSAKDIVGAFLWNKSKEPLYKYAQTNHLWLQRISIISTFYFIQHKSYTDTLVIARILLNHPHDLIHKAVGWMLREVGKRDFDILLQFLLEDSRYKVMPRTMLRYSIERFPEVLRQQFLKGLI